MPGRIVIVGAGYGGLVTALRLEALLAGEHRLRDAFRVTLVDQHPFHQLITRIPEVVGGRLPPEGAAASLARLLRGRDVDLVHTRVTGFDPSGRRVLTEAGPLAYARLVVALGSQPDFHGVAGVREHAYTVRTLPDAYLLRRHLAEVVAAAAAETDPARRRALLTFVVGGGGSTGTEIAAELAEAIPELAAARGLPPGEVRVILAEATRHLLVDFEPRLAARATGILEAKGVEVWLRAPVVGAGAGHVVLGDRGTHWTVATHTLVWAGGVCAPDTLFRGVFPQGRAGRILVDGQLRVRGEPDVYVVGDSALLWDKRGRRPASPSAQVAVQAGDAAAKALVAELQGREAAPFRPRLAGQALPLGPREAVGWIAAPLGRLHLSGLPALAIKHLALERYLYLLGGVDALRRHAYGAEALDGELKELGELRAVEELRRARA